MKLMNLIEVMDERLIIRICSVKKHTTGEYLVDKKLNMETQSFEDDNIRSLLTDSYISTVADFKKSKIYHKIATAELVTWSIARIKNFENFKNTEFKGRIVMITIVSL